MIHQFTKTHARAAVRCYRRRWCCCALGLMSIVLPGCRSSESYSNLEQELRGREAQVRNLESQIAESEKQLQDQDLQLAAHRMPNSEFAPDGQFAFASQSKGSIDDHPSQIPEEVLAAWGSVRQLEIQKLVSGIQWDADRPFLHAVIRPVDADGELCKVAGQLSVTARGVTIDNQSQPLVDRAWTITESRDLWTNAFVSSGFHVRVPIDDIQTARNARQLLVTATLKLGQGRTFEVSETLNLPVSAK